VVSSPLLLFQQARAILCLCPCCGEIVRLSDLKLRYESTTPVTWLDKYQRRLSRLEKREVRFDEMESTLRQEAQEKGRKQARRRVQRIIESALPGCKYHPQDIKALLYPIDYIAFCGMTEGSTIDKIVCLSINTDDKTLVSVRKGIERTVNSEDYSWNMARVLDDGTVRCERE